MTAEESIIPAQVVATPKVIRVLYIIDSLASSGGAELALLRLTRSLPKDQFDCRILTFHLKETIRALAGCPVIHWQLDSLFSWRAVVVARMLVRLVRDENIDIVHTVFQTSDLWAGQIAKFAGAKVLISSRRDMGILRKPHHSIGYRLLGWTFDQIQSVSEGVRLFTLRQDRVNPDRMVTVYNGVDSTPDVSPAAVDKWRRNIRLPEGSVAITVVASFRRVKGIDVMVRAAELIQREAPNARVLVAGHFGLLPEDHVHRNEVMRLNTALGTRDSVRFLGETKQVNALLAMSDIFVLPSRSEGFSNALLEAMAMGLPCVVTAVGGNPEVVLDGETGFIVPPEDPEALAQRILALVRDPDLRRRMGTASRERVKQRFTVENMTSQIQATYNYALKQQEWEATESKAPYSAWIRPSVSLPIQKLASGTGLNAFLRTWSLRKHFLVLCYHGVLKRSPEFRSSYAINVLADQFDEQMKFLARNFHVMSGSELLAVRQGHQQLQPRSVLVTFDDGYENNLTNAAPILRAHRVPAVFLISTGHIGRTQLLWPDEVFLRVIEWPNDPLPLPDGGVQGLPRDQAGRASIAERVRGRCKLLTQGELIAYLEVLRMGGPLSSDAYRREEHRFLTWDQVRDLSTQGFEIGSHTVTHPILSRATAQHMALELRESKACIERELRRDCGMVAYPNGLLSDAGKPVWDAAEAAGYSVGFMLRRGLGSLHHPMTIDRINVPGDEPPAVFESRAADCMRSGLYGADDSPATAQSCVPREILGALSVQENARCA